MVAEPPETPNTSPVVAFTLATALEDVLHVPPGTVADNDVDPPVQTVEAPKMEPAEGVVLTDTGNVATDGAQPAVATE